MYSRSLIMVRVVFSIAALCVLTTSPHADIMVVEGNKAANDQNWPQGTLPLANMEIRLGYWEGPPFGGGQYQFLYRGKTKQFAEALGHFGRIVAPRKELIIRDGKKYNPFLKKEGDPEAHRIDWAFTVWNPENWYRLYNNPKTTFMADMVPQFRQSVDPPKLEVYLSGSIDWSKISVPKGITVIDQRLSKHGYKATDGAVVRANVFDMRSSKPIENAKLILEPREKGKPNIELKTDNIGRVELKQVPPGTYGIVFQANGYVPRRIGYEAVGKQTFLDYTEIQLVKGVRLKGQLTDDFGEPIEDVRVRIADYIAINGFGYQIAGNTEAKTKKDGTFEFPSLPPGYCHIRCYKQGFTQSDSAKLHQVPWREDIKIGMAQAGMLRVVVEDKDGNAPTGNYQVHIDPEDGGRWGGGAKLNERGVKVFKNVPPGKYKVTARPNPYRSDVEYPTRSFEMDGKKAVTLKLIIEK